MTEAQLLPSCTRVRDRLDRLLDHELEPLAQALDRGHLEACAGCAAEERLRLLLLEGVRAAGAPPAGEVTAALAGVAQRLAREPVPTERRGALRLLRSRPVLALATAAAAVLLLLALETTGHGIGSWVERGRPPTLPDWELALPDGIDLLGGAR